MVIIAAIDRSARASSVVTEGKALADALEEPLHVVHVLTRSKFIELGLDSVDKSGEAVALKEIRDNAKRYTEKVTTDLEISCKTVGLVGDIPDRIIEYSKDQNGTHIVVGPRKRSPTGKAIFGSTAQAILLGSPLPVVTVIQQ